MYITVGLIVSIYYHRMVYHIPCITNADRCSNSSNRAPRCLLFTFCVATPITRGAQWV